MKNITDDVTNAGHSYVTYDDFCRCFDDETLLLAVRAPSGTRLEVPRPGETRAWQKCSYQIRLKSSEGQIYVLLVNKDHTDDDDGGPVAVQPLRPLIKASTKPTMMGKAKRKKKSSCRVDEVMPKRARTEYDEDAGGGWTVDLAAVECIRKPKLFNRPY